MGAGRVDAGGGGSGLGHWSLCCADGGRPGPGWSPGTGQMEGRGGVAAWGAGGHLGEQRPPSTSRGWKQAGGRTPCPSDFLDRGPVAQSRIRGGGGIHAGAPSPPLLRVVCQCQEAVGCRKAGLGRGGGCLLWGRAALDPRVPSALAPMGPLCSEGGKATEGFCQLRAGAGSRGLLSWLRSVAWRGPVGLVRSGQIPGFSSTGRYCTEQEEVPIGEEGNQASLFFLPFFTLQGLWVSSRTGPCRRAGPRRTQVASPLLLMAPLLQPRGQGTGAAVHLS